jgi:hypothetical protein
MWFDAREIPAYAEPIMPDQLKSGEVYWTVRFIDKNMLIPTSEPRVFIGRDLEAGDCGMTYFQDARSYFDQDSEDGEAMIVAMHESDLIYVFQFDRALDRLLECSLRRKAQ